MTTIWDSIGNRFEDALHARFPELVPTEKDEKNGSLILPDFHHPSGFWIEAKVGNIGWGVRIKRYQIEGFRDLDEPVIYAVGMHDFNNAGLRLLGRTESERTRILRRDMNITQIYFVNEAIMESIWKRENRWNKQRTIEYCMVKKGVLNHVLLNREMVRNGRRFSAAVYYRFNHEQFLVQGNSDTYIEDGCSYRAILDPEADREAITYLREQGVLAK